MVGVPGETPCSPSTSGGQGAIVLERLNDLENSIRRWLENNGTTSTSSSPSKRPGDRSRSGYVLRTYCPHARALAALRACHLAKEITILRTEYPARDLSIVDVLNKGCSKGHALERWASTGASTGEQVCHR